MGSSHEDFKEVLGQPFFKGYTVEKLENLEITNPNPPKFTGDVVSDVKKGFDVKMENNMRASIGGKVSKMNQAKFEKIGKK